MIIEETELFDKEVLIGGDLGYANKSRTKAITISDYGDGYRIRQYVSNGDMDWQRVENIPMQLPVKPANGVNISEDKECDSIILEKSGLRYECYFDKKYHQIFVGEPQNGSLISIGTPDNLAGTLKVEYYPKF